MSVFAATADQIDIGALAGAIQERGWWIDAQSPPPAIHFTVFPRHARSSTGSSTMSSDASRNWQPLENPGDLL